jgi:hypothetical protein
VSRLPIVAASDDDEVMHLTAHSYETLAADHPLAFPVPFGQFQRAQGFEQNWHYIHYVFDLPDPRTFPPLPHVLEAEDIAILRRYRDAARGPAEGSFLRHPIELSISFDQHSATPTTTNFPQAENIRGFSVLFRQIYEPNEPASFNVGA